MSRPHQWLAALLALSLLAACAPAPARAPAADVPRGAEPAVGPKKSITVSALNPIRGFGPWLLGSTQGGAASLAGVHSNTLASTDAAGNLDARLATKLPSFDDGTIVVLPDRRMQTTWKLRPNVKWHDGPPFSADDVIFGWEAAADPDVPSDQVTLLRNIERVDAPDSLTAMITWKTTYFQSMRIGPRDGVWPLPKHLLGDTFAADKQAFLNSSYWTTAWVHLGPFRLVDFGLGEHLIFERFDDYFLGRPKIDSLVIRIIPDANTLFANLQSGAIDIVTEDALPDDLFAELRSEWQRSGAGSVKERQGNWKFLSVQFNQEWGRPPELAREVRIRRGLYLGLDRDAVRDLLFPGFANTEADSFIVKNDPRWATVGQPFARYRYDPSQATRELAEGGWRRGPDGRLVNAAGEPVRVGLRGTTVETKESALISDNWRQLGLEIAEETMTPNLISDREYRAKFPSFEIVARGNGETVLERFHGGQTATAANRFNGTNQGGYQNATLDALIDRLRATIDEKEQGSVLAEIGETLATDLPALPTYFRVRMAAVSKGVRALDDYSGAILPGVPSRNAHLWDRD